MRWEVDESFRRAALFLAKGVAERGLDSVLFSSALKGEGTTTVVLNIAFHLKLKFDLTPLVIEVNRENPTFARLFKLDPRRTLYSVIVGETALTDCVQRGPGGIGLIPVSGAEWPSNREVRWKPLVERVLREVKDHFDIVLVDTPPILGEVTAIALGQLIPRLILVVEAGRTRYEILERVKDELEQEAVEIVGTVLNKHKRFIPGWLYRMLLQ